MLNKNERLDDLERNGLRIIQNKELYCFTQDSVLLAHFSSGKKGETALDIGTGSGVVATLLCALYPFKQVTGIEIQPCLADMAIRSAELNNLPNLNIVQANVNGFGEAGAFDVVVSNPPYGRIDQVEGAYNQCEMQARFELTLTLSQLMQSSARLLRFGGRLYLVHRAERLSDIICEMRANGIEPKRLRSVVGKQGDKPKSILIEGRRGGKSGIIIEPELICYNKDGSRTEELKEIYGRN